MIGIVVVSHSQALARAAIALASEMVPAERRPPLLAAGGLDETAFGTDAARIAEAVGEADTGDGVLVLLDLGSAILSAELAVEFLDPDAAARVRVSPAPLVEGLVAAVVTASAGASLEACDAEARRGLAAKQSHLGGDPVGPSGAAVASAPSAGDLSWSTAIDLPHGLHARPAAALVAALAGLDAEVVARNPRTGAEADAGSAVELMGLDLRDGDELAVTITGPDAAVAREALERLAGDRFGEG